MSDLQYVIHCLGLCKRTIIIEMAEFCFSAGAQQTSGAQAATSLSTAAGQSLSLFLSSLFGRKFYSYFLQ